MASVWTTLPNLYPWFRDLEAIVREKTLPESSGHDFCHSLRVLNLCLKLADNDSDLEVLIAAAILHDIARSDEYMMRKPSSYHIAKGAEIAEALLSEISFPKSKIEMVKKCILEHEEEGSDKKESQILQDADKLDSMGAVGIARCFTYGGKVDRPIWSPINTKETWQPGVKNSSSIAHLYARILGLANKMNTEKGKEMANARLLFTMQFINQFNTEMEGSLSLNFQ